VIVNVGRTVLYASSGEDFAQAARRSAEAMRDELNSARA
jgi:orotidine-5'-phosphate decarboxylase